MWRQVVLPAQGFQSLRPESFALFFVVFLWLQDSCSIFNITSIFQAEKKGGQKLRQHEFTPFLMNCSINLYLIAQNCISQYLVSTREAGYCFLYENITVLHSPNCYSLRKEDGKGRKLVCYKYSSLMLSHVILRSIHFSVFPFTRYLTNEN